MRKTLTLSALATAMMFASKGSTQTPAGAYAVPLPAQAVPQANPSGPGWYSPGTDRVPLTVQAVPQAYLPPTTPALSMPAQPPRPPEMATWTAPRAEPARLVTKVFDITEIILQVGTKGSPAAVADRAERLTALLEGFVEPNSWKCAGGRGSMVFFAENYSLVVNNEPKVVASVETWLDKLRTATKPEVKVGIDRIRCDSATFAKLGFAGRKAHEPIPLTPGQLAETMKLIETDARFERLEAPRMLLLDNQTGFFQIGQQVESPVPAAPSQFVGFSYRATPRIMPDGRTILLRLESELCDAAPCKPAAACTEVPCPMTAAPAFNVQSTAMTLAVPNGGTVLVPMGAQTVDERIMTKVPVIADLPMFDKLFSHTRTEPRQYETFVLVTANTQVGGSVAPPAPVRFTAQRPMPTTMPVVHLQLPVMPTQPPVTVPTDIVISAQQNPGCLWTSQPKASDLESASIKLSTNGVCGLSLERRPERIWSAVPEATSSESLVAAYRKACAEGRMVEARNFALQALAADPKCFENK